MPGHNVLIVLTIFLFSVFSRSHLNHVEKKSLSVNILEISIYFETCAISRVDRRRYRRDLAQIRLRTDPWHPLRYNLVTRVLPICSYYSARLQQAPQTTRKKPRSSGVICANWAQQQHSDPTGIVENGALRRRIVN